MALPSFGEILQRNIAVRRIIQWLISLIAVLFYVPAALYLYLVFSQVLPRRVENIFDNLQTTETLILEQSFAVIIAAAPVAFVGVCYRRKKLGRLNNFGIAVLIVSLLGLFSSLTASAFEPNCQGQAATCAPQDVETLTRLMTYATTVYVFYLASLLGITARDASEPPKRSN